MDIPATCSDCPLFREANPPCRKIGREELLNNCATTLMLMLSLFAHLVVVAKHFGLFDNIYGLLGLVLLFLLSTCFGAYSRRYIWLMVQKVLVKVAV